MEIARIDVKHQVTIPDDALVALGLKAGDAVRIELSNGTVVISPLAKAAGEDDEDEPSPEQWEALLRASMPEWFDPEEDAYWADL